MQLHMVSLVRTLSISAANVLCLNECLPICCGFMQCLLLVNIGKYGGYVFCKDVYFFSHYLFFIIVSRNNGFFMILSLSQHQEISHFCDFRNSEKAFLDTKLWSAAVRKGSGEMITLKKKMVVPIICQMFMKNLIHGLHGPTSLALLHC